jgi:hypothetical protein
VFETERNIGNRDQACGGAIVHGHCDGLACLDLVDLAAPVLVLILTLLPAHSNTRVSFKTLALRNLRHLFALFIVPPTFEACRFDDVRKKKRQQWRLIVTENNHNLALCVYYQLMETKQVSKVGRFVRLVCLTLELVFVYTTIYSE